MQLRVLLPMQEGKFKYCRPFSTPHTVYLGLVGSLGGPVSGATGDGRMVHSFKVTRELYNGVSI
jgi:hypothetical protein